MKRSALSRGPHRPKPKAHPADLPKNTGQRLIDKNGHRRSRAHIELVRAQHCLVSRRIGPGVVAHHPDEIFPELIAQQRKISDFLAVPLLHEFHDPGHEGALHKSNNAAWWEMHDVDPLRWLLGFLKRHYPRGTNEGADEAVDMVQRRVMLNGGVHP